MRKSGLPDKLPLLNEAASVDVKFIAKALKQYMDSEQTDFNFADLKSALSRDLKLSENSTEFGIMMDHVGASIDGIAVRTDPRRESQIFDLAKELVYKDYL